MSMHCFQCQETAKNKGCTVRGICGKKEETANLQDLLIYVLKGISIYALKAKRYGISEKKTGLFIAQALFATITNTNFDENKIKILIKQGLGIREELKSRFISAYKKKKGKDF